MAIYGSVENVNASILGAVTTGAIHFKGDKGEDGITPHIGDNGNWYIGDVDTGKPSCGDISDEELAAAVEAYYAAHPYTETDPTISAWAKAKTKPTYTAAEVGAQPTALIVEVTESGDALTANVSFNDIVAAHNSGKDVKCLVLGEYIYRLIDVTANAVFFEMTYESLLNLIKIDSENAVTSFQQNLAVTKSGIESALGYEPAKTMFVNITLDGDNKGTSDKTPKEIYDATQDGYAVFAKVMYEEETEANTILPCTEAYYDSWDGGYILFAAFNATIIDNAFVTTWRAVGFHFFFGGWHGWERHVLMADEVVDDLTTDSSELPLSAAQGKALKKMIDGITIPTVPTVLPNPNALTIKVGDSTIVYDGTEAQTIEIKTGTDTATYTWDCRRDEIKNYLDNVTYDPSDYSASEVDDYYTGTGLNSNYPVGKTVDIGSAAATIQQSDAYSGRLYSFDGSGSVSFYNAVPNVYSPVNIVRNNIVQATYQLYPTGALRMLYVPGTFNVRDLGGWACDGGTVKYGLLIRGGRLLESSKAVCLDQLGIRCDLDLRGSAEAGITVSPLGASVDYVCATNYNWYSIADKETWATNLLCVIEHVIKNEPVYFHCTAGADRTGTLACVIEAILGMSQSDIDKDYELTSFYSGIDSDANARRRNESEWKGLINAINAYAGDTFRDKAVNFAVACGISISKLNAFRAAMIDGTPDILEESTEIVNIVDTLGISANTRVGTSDGTNKEAAGYATIGANMTLSNMINANAGDVLRIKGMTLNDEQDSGCAICTYDEDGNYLTAHYIWDGLTFDNMSFNTTDDMMTIKFSPNYGWRCRVSAICTDASAVIATINQEIE